MEKTIKSRDYHRAYKKWDQLLLDGKTSELKIIPGGKSDSVFVLRLEKQAKGNGYKILKAFEKLPKVDGSLLDTRKDYDGDFRL